MAETFTPQNQGHIYPQCLSPPDGKLEDAQGLIESKVIDILSTNPGDIVVMGDINVDYADYKSPQTKTYKQFVKTL